MNTLLRTALLIATCLLTGSLPPLAAQSKLQESDPAELAKQGAYCELLAHFEQRSNKNPASYSPAEQLWYGEALLVTEQWDRLAAHLEQIKSDAAGSYSNSDQLKYKVLSARLLEKKEHFAAADSLYQGLVSTASSLRQTAPKDWAYLLGHYGIFLYQIERYKQSEALLDSLLELTTTQNALMANIHRIQALNHQTLGRYRAAADLHQRGLDIWEAGGWKGHPLYAEALNDYALLKISRNQLPEAEQLLEQSEAINALCPITSARAYNLAARGNIRLQIGDLEGAEQLFQQAHYIFSGRDQRKESALLLNQIGRTYLEAYDLETAGQYFSRALAAIEEVFPSGQSLNRALILDGLAQVNDYMGISEVADSLYRLEQVVIQALMGTENKHFSTALNNHAGLKEYISENEAAASLYRRSLEIIEPVLGPQHPEYLTTLYNLARLFVTMGQIDSAAVYYRRANELQLDLLNLYFSSFDEQTRLAYRLKAMGNFDLFFNFACFADKAQLVSEIQEINLATKNLVLDYSVRTRFEDSVDEQLRQQWLTNRELLAQAFQMTLPERQSYQLSLDSLQEAANELERKLIRQIPGQENGFTSYKAEDLITALGPEEAAIDFFTFGHHDGYEYTTDSLLYFALISRADLAEPILVYLCNNKSLEAIFNSGIHYTTNTYLGANLYELIWQPLMPWLQGISEVHLSPDGLLYQVSFEGLFTASDGQETLSERYQFSYYSNLRDFLQPDPPSTLHPSALLIGDPAFSMDSTAFIRQQLAKTEAASIELGMVDGPFPPLPGTAKEIQTIRKRLRKKRYQVSSFQGAEAMERCLTQESTTASPGIIHLSTHGYFLPKDPEVADTNSLTYRYGMSGNPMLRSGLAFSGANYTWNGGKVPLGLEDGVLTAEEVANLDLSQTELTILSACETGLGKVTDGEGVFGLQRAFKLAGVNQLIISLWKVPDAHTALLMDYFYRYYLRTQDSQLALRKAQEEMKKDYGPNSWAGFILFN